MQNIKKKLSDIQIAARILSVQNGSHAIRNHSCGNLYGYLKIACIDKIKGKGIDRVEKITFFFLKKIEGGWVKAIDR